MASEVQLALTAARLAAGLLEQGAVAVGLPPHQARAHHDDHGAVERAHPGYHRPPGHAGQPACQLGAHLCCRWLKCAGLVCSPWGVLCDCSVARCLSAASRLMDSQLWCTASQGLGVLLADSDNDQSLQRGCSQVWRCPPMHPVCRA